MIFYELLNSLTPLDANAPLVFEIDDHEIGAGYHVTELRLSMTTGIDCGGNVETWQEARLQLLDSAGETHMSVSKFNNIIQKSLSKLPGLSEAPLLVEFSPDNNGLKLMTLGEPQMQNGCVILRLHDTNAVCKPAQRSKQQGATSNGCCGGSSSASACCSSGTAVNASDACCA